MSRYFIAILLCATLFACKSGVPKDIIQPEAMEQVLFDIHIVDGYTSIYNGATQDSLTKAIAPYYKGVYKKHNIDSATYRKSLEYYYKHPELLKNMYDNIGKKLAVARDQISKAEAKEQAAKVKAEAAKLKAAKDKAIKIREKKVVEEVKPEKVQ